MSRRMSARVEPATEDDIRLFARDNLPTLRAWAGKVDGETVALFGLAREDGRWWVFFNITDEARPYKVTIAKAAKMLMAEARKMGLAYVYAVPDENEPMAVRWMLSLGFKPDQRSGSLMRWTNG
jgi:hypothetical protein